MNQTRLFLSLLTVCAAAGLAPAVTLPARAQTARAVMTFREAASVWRDVRKSAAELDQTIKAGKLGDVHEAAFAVRDRVVTLPYNSEGLSASNRKKLDQHVRAVAVIAKQLDKHGDANNASGVRLQQTRLKQTLAAIQGLYPAGTFAAAMPQTASGKEAALFLTPGGAYTKADIAANGNKTVSQKYPGFVAAHDPKPKMGERVCPITDTKANPNLTWVVGGKTYQFCCPPCVTEFVTKAKTNPASLKDPAAYVKK